MKISLNWLKEFIEITESPEELGQILTNTGLEVEDIIKVDSVPGGLDGFVIGQVLTCEPFDVKEKTLHLTTVNIGAETPSQIVCGASNVAAGQKVVVATLGTQLYAADGKPSFKIESRKVYGQLSEGMICAEDEIGVGQSHDGILVIETELPLGTAAAKFFKLSSDFVFEIGLTPNRADAASHLGVARDIKAATGRPIKLPSITHYKENSQKSPIEVSIENTDACQRFCGINISGVTVAESPEWLKKRLKAIGLNPINNIVDITNYVNHELGQPLHAYDATEIIGNKIIAKNIAEGSKFVTLDGIERSIAATDLMICNSTEPMGIAGIFGGQKSGIKPSTKDVFIEVAYFEPSFIRKTAQNHSLKTDASFRFERGTDPNLKPFTIMRAASLIVEIAGGSISSEIIDLYPNIIENFEIETSYKHISDLIGVNIAPEKIKEILTMLDISIEDKANGQFKASVPPYRVDVQREVDLVEEVLRIYGFENVPLSDSLGTDFLASFPENDKYKLQVQQSAILVGAGFNEIQTNSLTKDSYHAAIKGDLANDDVTILNILSEDLGVMRQTLLFTGMEVLAYNINRRQKDLKLFEFGKTYHKSEKYKENNRLAMFVAGNVADETWQFKNQKANFHTLANEVQKVFDNFRIKNIEIQPIETSQTYTYGLKYLLNKKEIASIGLIASNIAKLCDLKSQVFFADMDWDYILKQYKSNAKYTEISKYPEVRRDLSLVIENSVTYAQIQALAQKTEKKLLKNTNAFDVYQGENLNGKKSYSVSFILQDNEQTLTDSKIDGVMQNLIRAFEKELGAVIRS